MNLACEKLGRRGMRAETAVTPVCGGENASASDLIDRHDKTARLPQDVICSLVDHYGSRTSEVLACIDGDVGMMHRLGCSRIIKAQVQHAVRDEMAQSLGDVVFRRTDLGTAGHPGIGALEDCAEALASELHWTRERTNAELDDVVQRFPPWSCGMAVA